MMSFMDFMGPHFQRLGFTLECNFILKQHTQTWFGPPYLDKDTFHHLFTTVRILKSEQLRISKYILPLHAYVRAVTVYGLVYATGAQPQRHMFMRGLCNFFDFKCYHTIYFLWQLAFDH